MAEGGDMDLSSFMEVVTTYKCKFCAYVCSQPQMMSNHVKTSHIHLKPNNTTMSVDKRTTQCVQMVESCSNQADDKQLVNIKTETNSEEIQSEWFRGDSTVVSIDGHDASKWEKCENIKTEVQECCDEFQSEDYVTQICSDTLKSASTHDKTEMKTLCATDSLNHVVPSQNLCTTDSLNHAVQSQDKQTDAAMNPTVIICMTLPSDQDCCTDGVISNVEKSLESDRDLLLLNAGRSQDSAVSDAGSCNRTDTNPILLGPELNQSSKKQEERTIHTSAKSEFVADQTASSLASAPRNRHVLVSSGQDLQQTSADLTHTVTVAAPTYSLHGASANTFVSSPESTSVARNSQMGVTCASKTSVACPEPSQAISDPHGGTAHVESIQESETYPALRSEEDIIIKELFLCGLCSQTFCSIEAVGDHMRSSHPEAVGLLNRNTTGNLPNSASNQGQEIATRKKKPGRKKKSEMIRLEAERKEETEDEDWQPGRDLGVRHDGRKRRKTRPPRALKKDYYIETEKKVSPSGKKRRNRYSIVDSHFIKCQVFGCQARFMFRESLEYHLRCHDDCGYLTCPECRQEFRMWSVLKLHLWKDHRVDLDLFQCDECQYKVDTVRKLNIHKEIHSDSRPYTCDICGKGFKQFSQMKNHQVIHEGRDPKSSSSWYGVKQCKTCERWYANKKSLQKHVEAVHHKVRPFTCPFCEHTAARKAMIQLHIRTHTGEKPFTCNVCQYSTGDHNSMRKHRMRHTGQRQYKCKYCSYSCIQAISLKSHLRTKHPGREGVYLCGSCSFKTVNKIHYDNHLADHRNGLVQASTVTATHEEKPKRTRVIQQRAGNSLKSEPVIQVENLLKPEQVIQVGSCAVKPDPVQVEMQMQTMDSGEAQISVEDLARLTNCAGLLSGEVTAVQLIYSALSAISQNSQTDGTQTTQLAGGIETVIRSESGGPGVTTHTITFRVPAKGISSHVQAEQVIYAEPVEVVDGGNMDEQTTLQIDLDAVTVTSVDGETNVDLSNTGN
ncbi:uncharacterized protein LOC121388997 [Gigantopelta aegis]|uniref:uncharacterized protein LOC121388997 n=1 Tax=Gigantopelta aegis TaxID=1735272 RepID=UPI001B889B18|nr:uncharacterized protein LOC121388997 [Gigantopelta aegis]